MGFRTLACIGAALLGIGALFLAGTPDAAAKGGGGTGGGTTVDSGTIYYRIETSAGHTYYRMNPDGTGKAPLPAGVWGQPSYVKHGATGSEERWFLHVKDLGGNFGTGEPQAELVAVSESGVEVQITDLVNSRVVPDHSGLRTFTWERCRWVGPTTDGRISFLGYEVGATLNTQWGLYVVNVNWGDLADGNTSYTPGTMTLISELGTWRAGGPDGLPHRGWYQNIEYAWSPDGNSLAYAVKNDVRTSWWDIWNLNIRTFKPGTTETATDKPLRVGAEPHDWSVTGKLLCRRPYGEIYSLNPDGTGYLQLVAAPRESVAGPVNNYDARWSPAANYIVYSYQNTTSSDTDRHYVDVRRVSAQGTGDTNLTSDLPGWVRPIAWR
jgi:hypothetical protein